MVFFTAVGLWLIAILLVFDPALNPLFAYPTPMDLRGKLIRWRLPVHSPSLCYRLHADHEDDLYYYTEIVDHAAALWSSIPESRISLERCYEGNEHIALHLQRAMTNEPFASGYAQFDAYDRQGNPRHCSVFIKSDLAYSSDSVAKTILHEFGHCLGLEHSLIPEAIMSYHTEENRFELDLDDQAAICRLYPRDKVSGQLPPGCAVGADSHLPADLRISTFMTVLLLISPLAFALGFKLFAPLFWRNFSRTTKPRLVEKAP